jgi:4'-phosphopantetheinyl transferase
VRVEIDCLNDLLAPEERGRLSRLQLQEDRERFLLGRGVLRLVLGAWLQRHPADLRFAQGPQGKPELLWPESPHPEPGQGAPTPRFNVSHSGDLILLGFHPIRNVGVDLERRRVVPEWEGIARRCLPAGSWETIKALPEEQHSEAFLVAWCRLEADLKARGLGLFRSKLEGGRDTAQLLREPSDLWTVSLPQGYLGAAALA